MSDFDYTKWINDGADPAELPAEKRMQFRAAWDQQPASDPLAGIMRTNDLNEDTDKPLRRSDVQGLFNEAQRRARVATELDSARSQYGDDYTKYADAAKPHIERGLMPSEAFRLASYEDTLAATAETARKEALAGVQTQTRNGEQPARGNGAHGSGASSNNASSNLWISDKDAYTKKRDEIASRRMDFKEAAKFRVENPDFLEAEKHHGDLIGVSRR